MADGKKISELNWFPGGMEAAAGNSDVAFPVAVGNKGNARISAADLKGYVNRLVSIMLDSKADKAALEQAVNEFALHVENDTRHITEEERKAWNMSSAWWPGSDTGGDIDAFLTPGHYSGVFTGNVPFNGRNTNPQSIAGGLIVTAAKATTDGRAQIFIDLDYCRMFIRKRWGGNWSPPNWREIQTANYGAEFTGGKLIYGVPNSSNPNLAVLSELPNGSASQVLARNAANNGFEWVNQDGGGSPDKNINFVTITGSQRYESLPAADQKRMIRLYINPNSTLAQSSPMPMINMTEMGNTDAFKIGTPFIVLMPQDSIGYDGIMAWGARNSQSALEWLTPWHYIDGSLNSPQFRRIMYTVKTAYQTSTLFDSFEKWRGADVEGNHAPQYFLMPLASNGRYAYFGRLC